MTKKELAEAKKEVIRMQKQGAKNQHERSRNAMKVLNQHYEKGEHAQNVMDMLTDMRHLCDIEQIDFYDCLERSYTHYLAERRGED